LFPTPEETPVEAPTPLSECSQAKDELLTTAEREGKSPEELQALRDQKWEDLKSSRAFTWVNSDWKVARSARPGIDLSGHSYLKILKLCEGITTIVDFTGGLKSIARLRYPNEDRERALEERWCTGNRPREEVEYDNYPVLDLGYINYRVSTHGSEAICEDTLNLYVDFLYYISGAQNVLFHCRNGKDRTGLAFGLYFFFFESQCSFDPTSPDCRELAISVYWYLMREWEPSYRPYPCLDYVWVELTGNTPWEGQNPEYELPQREDYAQGPAGLQQFREAYMEYLAWLIYDARPEREDFPAGAYGDAEYLQVLQEYVPMLTAGEPQVPLHFDTEAERDANELAGRGEDGYYDIANEVTNELSRLMQ